MILQKTAKTVAYTKRKVTVRHEKKGWGVLDVGGPKEFKSMGVIRRNTGTGRAVTSLDHVRFDASPRVSFPPSAGKLNLRPRVLSSQVLLLKCRAPAFPEDSPRCWSGMCSSGPKQATAPVPL